MKIAPIIDAVLEEQSKGTVIHFRFIHIGQCYDKNMSDSFFVQWGIPQPYVNLGAGGDTQAVILPESWTRGLVKKSLNLTKR